MSAQKYYAAIDLKSFYASVECILRELDPLRTNLVVADASRTEKTICLAVSPSLKSLGVPGRPRLFEVISQVNQVNAQRKFRAPGGVLTGASSDIVALSADPSLAVDYIVAPPRMACYMEQSARIYEIYLKYVAPEDIHVYSIDEVFMDITPYLRNSGLSAREFVRRILKDVLESTGITATAGIGTNLYLCKVAMDIVAKHVDADDQGVRIAELDEWDYRRLLWDHRPLTDFWRIGSGYRKKLEKVGLHTMGDIARCSLGGPEDFHNEALLYRLFGVNAELLIDHAWGQESCGMAQIKAYKPQNHSISTGQVLHCSYVYEKAALIVREMADQLVLDLVDKGLVTKQVVLSVGYDIENLTDPVRGSRYKGAVTTDYLGRKIPKHAHGTVNFPVANSSTVTITRGIMDLFATIVDPELLVRRVNLTAAILSPVNAQALSMTEQLNFFSEMEAENSFDWERERRRQQAVLHIQKKYGKNAIIKGMNLLEGATTMDRNGQIGGHKA